MLTLTVYTQSSEHVVIVKDDESWELTSNDDLLITLEDGLRYAFPLKQLRRWTLSRELAPADVAVDSEFPDWRCANCRTGNLYWRKFCRTCGREPVGASGGAGREGAVDDRGGGEPASEPECFCAPDHNPATLSADTVRRLKLNCPRHGASE